MYLKRRRHKYIKHGGSLTKKAKRKAMEVRI
jgi:hypothetical protein